MKLINKKKFIAIILNKNAKMFVVYIDILLVTLAL